MSDYYDYDDDDTEVISEAQYRADVEAAAQAWLQEHGEEIAAHLIEQHSAAEEQDLAEHERALALKLNTLEQSIGREVTNRELDSLIKQYLSNPEADFDADSYQRDLTNDDERLGYLQEVISDGAAEADDGGEDAA